MQVQIFFLLLTVAANASLGLLVIFTDQTSLRSRLFGFTALGAAYWTYTNAAFLSIPSGDPRLVVWANLSYVGAVLTAASLAHFSLHFPRASARSKFLAPAIWILALAASMSAALPGLAAVSVDGAKRIITGPALPSIFIYLLLAFGFAAASFIFSLRSARGLERTQLRILLGGIAVSVSLGIAFNLLLPLWGEYGYAWMGPAGSVFFVGATVYAIMKRRLFDIRVILRRTVVYSALLGLILAGYTATIFLAGTVLRAAGDVSPTGRTGLLINVAAAALIAAGYEPLRRWLQDSTDRWLFKKEYEQQAVVKELASKLNDVIAMDEALELLMRTVTRGLQVRAAATYIFQRAESGTFAVKTVKQIGYESTAKLLLEDRDFTVAYFAGHQAVLDVREMELELERETVLIAAKQLDSPSIRAHAVKHAVYRKLASLDAEAAVPLHLNGEPIGLLLLSERLSGARFRPGDLELLETVGQQAISSIQKAKLYEGDRMKSEFVSIASHELLTPISAIEGYLSMILEENIGEVDAQAREYLTKVYTSAKRLSLLIKDLLSVSRIESGTMKYTPQQLSLAKLAHEAVDQLHFMIANKGLTLTIDASLEKLPPVSADSDRTMQVLTNLLSNAIKYTPAGSIALTSKLNKKLGAVELTITDTGLGMTNDQSSHLFNKFYRVDTPETTGIVGTGLGLYITKSIIEQMGGSIGVKSAPGKGTSFTVTFPLFRVEASAA